MDRHNTCENLKGFLKDLKAIDFQCFAELCYVESEYLFNQLVLEVMYLHICGTSVAVIHHYQCC